MPNPATVLPALADLAAAAMRDNPGWLDEAVDEKEAARVVDESVTTLRSKRTRGGGPVFVKSGSNVRYIRRDLFAYLSERRRASTSGVGKAA